MLAKVDNLIEKDGHAAKAAGILAAFLGAVIVAGLVPAQHVDAVQSVIVLLLTFAPAAMRREHNAKQRALEPES